VTRAASLPDELGEDFLVSTALASGIGSGRLRRTDLSRPFRGARSRSVPSTSRELARALAPILTEDQWFSTVTAADLQGMRMPEHFSSHPLHVTTWNSQRAMRRPGVVGHKTGRPPELRRTGDGLPVSSPTAAWVECAAHVTVDDLTVMADGLVSRQRPVSTIEELRIAAQSAHGQRGAARLREALTLVRPGTDSARETLLRLAVVRAGFPEPQVNAPIRNARGTIVAHGDLVWSDFRVVLEYEGRQHAEDPRQFAIDIRRLDDIAALEYRVIRVDRELFAARSELFKRITRGLMRGGSQPKGR
jgi:hypothetical protein